MRARVLYVTDGVAPHVTGGMQAVARRHIEWLSDAGYDVLTLYSNTPQHVAPDWPGKARLIPWRRSGWTRPFDPWRYVHELQAYSRAVTEVAEAFDPHLVYGEGPLLHAYLRSPDRAPVMFHPHGLEMFQHKGSLVEDAKSLPLRGIVRDHARRAEVVLCQGGDLVRLLEGRMGIPSSRIRLLPNTHARTAYSPGEADAGPRNRLLFVARNEPRKGLGVLLRTMARMPEAQLTVVGADSARGAGPNVHFAGVVKDRRKLEAMFDEADFLVLPSLAEGMPTVLVEALAAGLPAIASDVGAVREAVIEGQTGYLLPPGDTDALAAAIARAIALPAETHAVMRRASRALFDERFAPDRVRDTLLDIVDTALGNHRGVERPIAPAFAS